MGTLTGTTKRRDENGRSRAEKVPRRLAEAPDDRLPGAQAQVGRRLPRGIGVAGQDDRSGWPAGVERQADGGRVGREVRGDEELRLGGAAEEGPDRGVVGD